LPIHNGMPFLIETIKSLQEQTYKDFIVLFINNGSTDNSKEFITSINDKRFKYYELEEVNLVKALNYGLKLVNTEFAARMDADDISHPQRFEKQILFLESNKNIDIVGTQGRYIGSKVNRIMNINLPTTHTEIVNAMLNNDHAIIHASIFFRQSIIKNKYFYDEKFFPCEDFELFLRLSKDVTFANLTDRLYSFRVHRNSILSGKISESIKKYKLVSNRYKEKYISGRKFKKNKLFEKLDILSVTTYRKGLNKYLNETIIMGYFYFAVASLLNPVRLSNYIRKWFKSFVLSK